MTHTRERTPFYNVLFVFEVPFPTFPDIVAIPFTFNAYLPDVIVFFPKSETDIVFLSILFTFMVLFLRLLQA
jgi:hypothetical protein